MGLLSKAKVAAKRAALKRVPKVIRDLSPLEPLQEVKPAAQKSISAVRSQEPETQDESGNEERKSSTPTRKECRLPRPHLTMLFSYYLATHSRSSTATTSSGNTPGESEGGRNASAPRYHKSEASGKAGL